MSNIYLTTLENLRLLADKKYQAFNEKIANSSKVMLGVTVPQMRKLAGEIFKADYVGYLKNCQFKCFEDTMIYGFVLAKLPYCEFLEYLPIYLSNADSWAHIDSFVSSIKTVDKNRENFLEFIKNEIDGSTGFTLRFYLVSLMTYYLSEEYIDYVFSILESCDGKGYYNDMAIAWLISVSFVKFRDKTLDFIKLCKLSSFTLNKSISKIKDSFRVLREDKILLQNYIRKK